MSKVLVLGGYGLLGCSLCRVLSEFGHVVYRQGRAASAQVQCELTEQSQLVKVIEDTNAEIVINLVANADVDQCEEIPNLAFAANMKVVESLVNAVHQVGLMVHIIHISSDMVYDGVGPHYENHVSPINVYALTKLAGEYLCSHSSSTVLRTNFIGRSRSKKKVGLTDWIVNSLRNNKKITVFDDVLFSPLHIDMLCKVINLVIEQRCVGVFNLGCFDGGSKARLALGLAKFLGYDQKLLDIGSVKNVGMQARRPVDMRMNTKRFEAAFGFIAPSFESQIYLSAKDYMTNDEVKK